MQGAGLSSRQSAGVGGTGPSWVPFTGAVLVRNAGGGPGVDDELSDELALLRLWERADAGGGPGGGGGRGIPVSQPDFGGDLLAGVKGVPVRPMPPVEAARREAGGLGGSLWGSTGACCKA